MDEKKENDIKTYGGEPEAPAEPDEKIEFQENPYDPENKRPEDIVRLFYVHDLPVIPVASKRGIILGILHKADVISELSDIERAEQTKIDKFVTRLARKTNLDQMLKYSHIKEFIVINLFGEVQGKWSRLQLFNAIESFKPEAESESEVDEAEKSREEHVLEWMIYLILEHIPRGLYAVNSAGRTIFYNSLFEDYFNARYKSEVDSGFVENSLKDPDVNELVSDGKGSISHFFNTELQISYERIPLMSKGRKVGYLIFLKEDADSAFSDSEASPLKSGESLEDAVSHYEREIIVKAYKSTGSVKDTAEVLRINRRTLSSKMKKLGISIDE